MIVMCDFDGVLVEDTTPDFFEFAISVKQKNYCRQTWRKTHCWQSATRGESHERISEVYAEFTASDHFASPEPITGARDELLDLQEKVDALCIGTTRSGKTRAVTLATLEAHYNGVSFQSVLFDGGGNKVGQLQECRASVIIEDNPRYAELAVQAGFIAVLIPGPGNFDHPKRKGVLYPSVWNDLHNEPLDWQPVYRRAWSEVTKIVQSCIRT